ncbi:MAG: hypothetical protein IPM29_27460 [Planctomycetes bacterium]|nr:hypothetical protein [Planctomycetota bacterium]
MPRLALMLLLALLAAAVAWLALTGAGSTGPAPAPVDAPAVDGSTARAGEHRDAHVEPARDAPSPTPTAPVRERVATPVVDEPAGDGLATIVGRCVDEDGAPLAGVALELRGYGDDRHAVTLHELDHGPIDWSDPPPAHSDDHGRFEIRFAPPPPYEFGLVSRSPGRIAARTQWPSIPAGARIDLGDAVLSRGVLLRGIVVDPAGTALPEWRVSLIGAGGPGPTASSPVTPGSALVPRRNLELTTDAAGAFRSDTALPPGDYVLSTAGKLIDPPGRVGLAAPTTELRIVVEPFRRPEQVGPPIAGVVTDGRGTPIPDATLLAVRLDRPDGRIGPGGIGVGRTAPDGGFRIPQYTGADERGLRLRVLADGFEPADTGEPIPWGAPAVRIALLDGPSLTVNVRDATSGAPVERFGVQLDGPDAVDTSGFVRGDARIRAAGPHPGGTATIERLTPGPYSLRIVPAPSLQLPKSDWIRLEIEAGVPAVVDVVLLPDVARTIVLRDADGAPIVGSSLELVHPLDTDPVELDTTAVDRDQPPSRAPRRARRVDGEIRFERQGAVRVATATTDAAGRTTLAGPGDTAFALRVLGPGHPPFVVQPVRLDEPEPLEITAPSGATLRIRATPVEIATAYRVAVGLVDRAGRRSFPSAPEYRFGPTAPDWLPLDDDGRAVLVGIPPGRWALRVVTVGHTGGSDTRTLIEELELAAGEARDVALDLSGVAPATTTLVLTCNGRPFEGTVQLLGWLGGANDWSTRSLETGADGRVEVELAPGTWRTTLKAEEAGGIADVRSEPFQIGATPPAEVAIRVQSGHRVVRVLRANGEPAANQPLSFEGPIGSNARANLAADADGRATLRGGAGAVRVFGSVGRGPDQLRVPLGDVQLLPGGGSVVDLQLPPY